jgi:hypothetical protein
MGRNWARQWNCKPPFSAAHVRDGVRVGRAIRTSAPPPTAEIPESGRVVRKVPRTVMRTQGERLHIQLHLRYQLGQIRGNRVGCGPAAEVIDRADTSGAGTGVAEGSAC